MPASKWNPNWTGNINLIILCLVICVIESIDQTSADAFEKKEKLCAKRPCVRGLCKDIDNDFLCICPPGFTGKTCKDSYCDANPCKKGKCRNQARGFKCKCSKKSRDCDDSDDQVDPCDADPCANGGTCTVVGTAYSCACAQGWTGTNCTTRDYCNPNPCLNGASCSNGVSDYTCSCPSGWTGKNCDQPIDYCNPNPCIHGSCANGANGYTCNCLAGWSGVTCDHCTFCDSNPCQNGGSCVVQSDQCSCVCVDDSFFGTFCELAWGYK